MTNIDSVLSVLREHGPRLSSVEVAAHLPNLTPKQVQKALQNGAVLGRCHCVYQEKHPDCNLRVGIWQIGKRGQEPESLEPERDSEAARGCYGIPRVASVWDLGLIAANGRRAA